MPLTNQDSYMPTRKVQAAAITMPLATILAWVLGAFMGVDVPPGVEAAFASLAAVIAAYMVRERG